MIRATGTLTRLMVTYSEAANILARFGERRGVQMSFRPLMPTLERPSSGPSEGGVKFFTDRNYDGLAQRRAICRSTFAGSCAKATPNSCA